MAQIYETTLNGKKIYCKIARTTGGNKLASFDYPFQDKRYNQYLGIKPKDFTLNILVFSDELESLDYEAKKRDLISEFEKQQSCILVHPFFGELILDIENYSLVEEISNLGKCEFEVIFKEGTKQIYPLKGDLSKDNITSKKDGLVAKQNTNISKNLNKVNKFKQGFKKLKAKTNSLINKVNAQVDKVRAVISTINEVKSFITDFQTNINAILAVPDQFAGAVTGLINSITDLGTNPLDNFYFLKTLFDFGNDDQQSEITTTNNTLINENNNLVNFTVRSLSLACAYDAVANVEFANLDQLESIQADFETQYNSIINNQNFNATLSKNTTNKENFNNDILKDLANIRDVSNQYLKQISVTLPDVQDYEANENQPLTVFLYENYKNIDDEQTIIDLNLLDNPAFMKTSMQVLV